jgi:hypothetical protein
MTVGKFVLREPIEAMFYDGANMDEVVEWLGDAESLVHENRLYLCFAGGALEEIPCDSWVIVYGNRDERAYSVTMAFAPFRMLFAPLSNDFTLVKTVENG